MILQEVAKECQVLQEAAKECQVLQEVAKECQVLQEVAKECQVQYCNRLQYLNINKIFNIYSQAPSSFGT